MSCGNEVSMRLAEAEQLCSAVMEAFLAKKEGAVFREYAPVKQEDRENCFLWSYFAAGGMLYRLVKTGADEWRPAYEKIVEGFGYYRADKNTMPPEQMKYHSERGVRNGAGYGPCFFDDNIWVARNYLFAYEIFGRESYLEEAKRIVNYIYTGWNKELGGLVWNENGLTDAGTEQELERGLSANACCIIVNALLYQITGKESYLEWALRFYDFCKTTQDSDSKIYYNGVHTVIQDGVRRAGEVNRDLYGYNSGSMILADLLLYEITGQEAYRTDAFETAEAAHRAFLRQDEASGQVYYKDFIWFTAILAEGYAALGALEPDKVKPYFQVLDSSVTYAWEHFRKENGLLPHDYVTGWRQEDDYDRLLLTHSGTAEIACLTAMQGK